MARLPSSVRVGPHVYEIVGMTRSESETRDVIGECDQDERKIYVRKDLPPHSLAETLLHEILHACWYAGSLEDTDAEERTVNVLAMQMAMVIRDNPKLMSWIGRCMRSD